MSEFSNINDDFFMKHVRAVDQNKFESEILSKVDKAYKNHVDEEKSLIKKNYNETTEKVKVISKSIKELNDCLIYNLKNNKSSEEEFNKIQKSLQNQIDLKNQELLKLNRLEKRYKDQLTSFDISEKFNKILDDAGKQNIKKSKKSHSLHKKKNNKMKEPLEPGEILDSDDSDTSVASNNTMVFDHTNEQIEYLEPVIKKRKIVYEDKPIKKKIQRYKSDKTLDDANYDEFCGRIIEHKNQKIANNSENTEEDIDVDQGFSIQSDLWNKLYGYQQTGIRWLLQLHNNGVGGILGDEMGLGKTIQIIVFLTGLHRSKGSNYECGPILIVCPATVMRQWMDEFRTWAPLFRVALLHATGSGYDKPKLLIESIATHPGILVTTYSSMVLHHSFLTNYNWQYVILDEGHKIKNPNAKVTVCIKKFETPHRLILSGSPIQNNLKELWSLVDFVYPGKLGSLASFIQNFAVPIMKGGYEHASPLQVETAYRCACVIRDTINEYLLRRTKAEVELQLPRKTEQVLFCGLTEHQNAVYKEYLNSRQCKQILAGQQVPFPGLVMLRKICNHPDLVTGGLKYVIDHPILGFSREAGEDNNSHRFGHFSRSGKMIVVLELLRLWYRGKHKVLLFTQGRMMLQILKRFIEQQGYTLCTMDGSTAIGSRHAIVEKFNESPYNEKFIFLLTTRVGGLGLNLVGADRVLVYDPDWNPCTDLQARERAWRIGQNRKVVIYRLVISGSVEEKIYHRQVFKQFLTNRILKNPRQRRFFKTQDLRDLFRLDDPGIASDTSIMFRGTKHHKQLKSNYFDDSRLTIDAFNQDDDDEQETNIPDFSNFDFEINEATSAVIAESGLSLQRLTELRRKAKEMSKSLSNSKVVSTEKTLQQTNVEGEMINNVRAKKEYKPQIEDTSDKSGNAAQHIVSVLLPKKAQTTANISYNDVCAAEMAAERAKKSLEQTLANAGVTDRIYHDSVIADETPDWALLQREAETSAKCAVAWLQSHLLCSNNFVKPVFGTVKNSFLWNKDEENIYFQSLDSSTVFHHSNAGVHQISTKTSRHVRFSSPFLLTIVRNRSNLSKPGVSWDNSVVSSEVKTLIKNIYLFLTRSCPFPGQTTSNDIINHFRDQISIKDNLLFKTILNQLCTFQKVKNSKGGIWHLRVEFKNK